VVDYFERIFPKEIQLYLFVPEKFCNKFKSNRTKIVKTSCNKYNSFIELRSFCKNEGIDRIINIGVIPQEAVAMTLATSFTKTDFICFILGDPISVFKVNRGKGKIKAILETLLFYPIALFPKKIFVCSKGIFFALKKRLFNSHKLIYVPPTINTSFFIRKDKKACRKRSGIGLKEEVIIYVGRIEYLKGSDFLFNAIKDNPDKKFIVAGEISDKKFKNEQLSNLIILNQKSHEELVDYYNSADLFLFLSRLEGLPLAPREAMSCGTPALISDILGSRYIRQAIKTSLKREEINKKIREYFKKSVAEKEELSKKSRESIVSEYGENSCKELYLNSILS
jgi:glycosyltransferase involved in cell wall biosynthesis